MGGAACKLIEEHTGFDACAGLKQAGGDHCCSPELRTSLSTISFSAWQRSCASGDLLLLAKPGSNRWHEAALVVKDPAEPAGHVDASFVLVADGRCHPVLAEFEYVRKRMRAGYAVGWRELQDEMFPLKVQKLPTHAALSCL